MKKLVAVLLISILTVSMSSCSDVYDETIISDVELYDTIWELPERRVSETSMLFPNEIQEEQVERFNCQHTTYRLLGTGWQIELTILFDENTFNVEKDRLSNLCGNSIVCGESTYFDQPAYATVWNWNGCFEYAVINEREKSIGYVYLQLIETEDLSVDPAYVPHPYEMQLDDSRAYSAYL